MPAASLSHLISNKQRSICCFFGKGCKWCTWTFRLMDLPPEMRLMIFREAFTNTVFRLPLARCTEPCCTSRNGMYQHNYIEDDVPCILSVSKAIRTEALPVFRRETIVIPSRAVDCDNPDSPTRPSRQRAVHHCRYAYLDPSLSISPCIRCIMPNLKELRVRFWELVDTAGNSRDGRWLVHIGDDELVQRTRKFFYKASVFSHICGLLSPGRQSVRIILEMRFTQIVSEEPDFDWADDEVVEENNLEDPYLLWSDMVGLKGRDVF